MTEIEKQIVDEVLIKLQQRREPLDDNSIRIIENIVTNLPAGLSLREAVGVTLEEYSKNRKRYDYTKVVTLFSGVDYHVIVNGEQIKEVQEIRFTEDMQSLYPALTDEPPIQGEIHCVLTDGVPPIRSAIRKSIDKTELTLRFRSDHADGMDYMFVNPQFKERRVNVSPDNTVITEVYTFTAEDTISHKVSRS